MRLLPLVLALAGSACSTAPPAPVPVEPWRREVTFFEAGSLLPREDDAAPARLSLDGRVVWEGTIRRSRVKPGAFEAPITSPLVAGTAPEVMLTVGGRTFVERAPTIEPGKFLLLYCGTDRVHVVVDASRARE